jgi:hypothetical protein
MQQGKAVFRLSGTEVRPPFESLGLIHISNIMHLTEQDSEDDDIADRTFKPKKTPPISTDESLDDSDEVVVVEKPGNAKKGNTVGFPFIDATC